MLALWIWLSTREGLNERQMLALLEHFGSPEDIYYAEHPEEAVKLSEKALESLKDRDLTGAEEILEQCERKRIRVMCYGDPAYPERLRQMPDPPMVLYYKGRWPDFDRLPTIGVVGTRQASCYGLDMAQQMGGEIAACGGLVVSGLAAGVDAAAMKGALQGGSTAVGVLGCGADRVYPAKNRWLFEEIEWRGCIISEYPPGTPPNSWNFPKRNRIISGLSNGILVIEAPERSGALITARMALEYHRDVFAVPGNVGVESCAGSNSLLREGAMIAMSGWDVISAYEHLYPNVIEKRSFSPQSQLGMKAEPAPAQKPAETPAPEQLAEPVIDLQKLTATLTPVQQTILERLKDGERMIDDLILETGLTSAEVLGAITMMEISGILRSLPGRRVTINS